MGTVGGSGTQIGTSLHSGHEASFLTTSLPVGSARPLRMSHSSMHLTLNE